MSRSSQIRVAVADQHVLFAECLGVVLEMHRYDYRTVSVSEEAGQTGRVLDQLLAMTPDVAVVSSDLGRHCDGVALIAPMVRAGAAVVVLTETLDEAHGGRCLAEGARTTLAKSTSLSSMVSVVRRVSHGQPVLDRSERDRLIGIHRCADRKHRDALARLQRLTTQEGEVLRHLMVGRTVKEIATVRVVAEVTVRTQVKAILAKLELSSQLAAVAVAHQAGWHAQPLAIAG